MIQGWERSLKIVGLVAVCLVFMLGAYKLSAIFNPLLIALLLTYISDPIIARLEKVFKHRLGAIVFIYVYLLVLFILIPILVVGRLHTESSRFFVTLVGESFADLNVNGVRDPDEPFKDTNRNGVFDRPEDGYFYMLLDRAKEYSASLDSTSRGYLREAVNVDELVSYIKSNLRQIASEGTRATGWLFDTLLSSIQGAFDYLAYLIFVPIYTFFLLYEWNDIKRTLGAYLPGLYRDRIVDIVGKIDRAVSAFFRGRLIICVIKGVLTALGLWLCGVPFAFVIGVIAGFLSIIPFLGAIVGSIPSVTFVLIDYQDSLLRLVGVIVVFVAIEALEGFVLTPWILGKETGLHPITLILSLLAAAKLFGLFGLLLVVPVVAIIKILGKEFLLPIIEELAGERAGARPDSP